MKMGNLQPLQCGLSTTAYEDGASAVRASFRDMHISNSKSLADFWNCNSSALETAIWPRVQVSSNGEHHQSQFLHAHLRDRPRNTLLDYKLVVDALVEQVEELVRLAKEKDEEDELSSGSMNKSSKLSDIHTESNDWVQAYDDPTDIAPVISVPFRVRSTATVGTRASGATVVAGNSVPRRRDVKPKPVICDSPNMMAHNKFKLQDDLRKSIAMAIRSTERPEVLPRLFAPCIMSRKAKLFTDSSNDLNMVIDDNMLVLHLKMPPSRCYNYYNRKLSQWKPHHPLSLMMENGLETTDFLVPRKSCRGPFFVPDLASTSDESSTSHANAELEFGKSPPSAPVRLLATDSVFLDLAITGSLGLVVNKRRTRGAHMDRQLMKRPDQYTVLLNRRSGIPIAVCALKTPNKGPPIVRIFTTQQRVFGQNEAATTDQLGLNWAQGSLPLYPWAEIVTEGEYPEQVRYSIFLTTGWQGEFEDSPSYHASHVSPGSPEVRVMGRTEREEKHSGCAVFTLCQAPTQCGSDDDVFWKVSIARGIDPALMICFAAFVDEAMEKTMRKQYKIAD